VSLLSCSSPRDVTLQLKDREIELSCAAFIRDYSFHRILSALVCLKILHVLNPSKENICTGGFQEAEIQKMAWSKVGGIHS